VPGARHPEVTLSVPFVGSRLVAKYDLVVVTSEGDLTIFDWKTSRRRPSRRRLAERIQTRVYRALVVEAGAYLNGGRPVVPSRVRMTYWFADFPHQPETFVYDEVEHRADVDLLTQLIAEVRARAAEEDFALTDEERRCAYCTYRSLCRRGVEGGNLESWEAEEESDDLSDFDLDLDQVAEVEF
jgi:CRISPR/Cas system-associated exonuclease Cas4 (RecB family)